MLLVSCCDSGCLSVAEFKIPYVESSCPQCLTTHRASPEAWVSWLGHAVGLHYATLTLRTPVTYRLTVPPASPAPAVQSSQADHAHIHVNGSLDAAHEVDPYQQQLMQQPRQPAAEERVEEGRGVAHAEAQYGRAFPGRWLWVEGQVGAGQ